MNFSSFLFVFFALFNVLNVRNIAESALPFGVFPFLTTGWYYKPSPVESVIFGLMVVKVLAIRLASVTGILPIPYHLNDLFVRNLGKRSLSEYIVRERTNLTMPQQQTIQGHKVNNYNSSVESKELQAMYRLLLGVRRMDTTDCFLKALCFLGHDKTNSENISLADQELITTINYLTLVEDETRKNQGQLNKSPIMDVFQKAIVFGMESKFNSSHHPCDREYLMCPLTENDMMLESILSDSS